MSLRPIVLTVLGWIKALGQSKSFNF